MLSSCACLKNRFLLLLYFRFPSSPKWSILRCWHLGWCWKMCCFFSHHTHSLLNLTTLEIMLNSAPAPFLVPTASRRCLPWLGVCLCVSSTWERTWFPPSRSSAICVLWHVSESCAWLKTPVVERIPTGIACLCCAACLDCRSLTTKVSWNRSTTHPSICWNQAVSLNCMWVLLIISCDRGRTCYGTCWRWRGHYPTRQSQKSAFIQWITWCRCWEWPPILHNEGDQVGLEEWHHVEHEKTVGV